jgi:VWFA-related protein
MSTRRAGTDLSMKTEHQPWSFSCLFSWRGAGPGAAAMLVLAAAIGLCGFVVVHGKSTLQPPPRQERQHHGGQQQQDQPQDQQPPPRFRVEANFVRIDAYVTGRDGRPVQDLEAGDFEILEDGKRQEVQTFEHVVVRGSSPLESRIQPASPQEGRQMAADPRARLFVLFLDNYHVRVDSSHRIRAPLTRLLEKTIGADDLVAVMTPEMSVRELSFTRVMGPIQELLARYWYWGERASSVDYDDTERDYTVCYPKEGLGAGSRSPTAQEMIERRREQQLLAAMQDLVRELRGIREERKAILLVTEGWQLFRPNSRLANATGGRPPQIPGVFIGGEGRLSTTDPRNPYSQLLVRCETDRVMLAGLDNERHFREILDEANRANASFYPIDPRGLADSDSRMGDPVPEVSVVADARRLTRRLESLRTLAGATDGIAVLDSNDIEGGMRRIVHDLTSYYLLGYYSSNSRMDGRYRSISVRVKRPGVEVRARRGYRAPTEEEVAAALVEAPVTLDAETLALQAAVGALAGMRPERRLHVDAAWRGGTADEHGSIANSHVWVVAEIDARARREEEWRQGAEAEVTLSQEGTTYGKAAGQIAAGAPGGALVLELPDLALWEGEYDLRVRVRPAAGGLPLLEMQRLRLAAPAPSASAGQAQPLMLRRGQFTGGSFVPTADPRFRRAESLRVELPLDARADAADARLLDRAGQPMRLPVTVGERVDEDTGTTWVVAELALAPLAAGDYVLELETRQGEHVSKVLRAFRIVP